jgi:hypothetical protein
MKNILLFISILIFCFLQSSKAQIENLDKLNGFMVFKLGDPPTKHSGYIKKNDYQTPPSKKVSFYNCDEKEYLSFGTTFTSMELSFFESKLYEILLWRSWTVDEYLIAKDMLKKTYFTIIADEAENIFGLMMRNTIDEGALLKKGATGIWETEKIRFEIVFMQFYSDQISIQIKFIDKNLEKLADLSKYQ